MDGVEAFLDPESPFGGELFNMARIFQDSLLDVDGGLVEVVACFFISVFFLVS